MYYFALWSLSKYRFHVRASIMESASCSVIEVSDGIRSFVRKIRHVFYFRKRHIELDDIFEWSVLV